MTSKEALKEYYYCDTDNVMEKSKILYEAIEKDLERLERLEAIEDELGINLITLFKALKNGIYVIEDNDNYIVKDSIKSIENWVDGWGITTNMEYLELLFSDYGKTWALSREALL